MRIDLSQTYQPTKKQSLAHSSSARYVLFGGAMRGGKSTWGCMEGLQLSLEYPGNVGLICRWELSSLKRTTLLTLEKFWPSGLIRNYNRSAGEIELINGSITFCMGLKPSSEHSALERLKSLEVGWFFIDEATEIQKRYFELLKTRLSVKLPSGKFPRYRGLLASNPEPGWVRDTFIEQKLESCEFISALPSENPHLNPDYIANLIKDLPPELVKKYLDGDWDVMTEGLYIFPYQWIKAAVDRTLKEASPCELGVDIARFGGDENIVARRRGPVVRIVHSSVYKDTMITTGEVALVIDKEKPEATRVDTVGVGAGVYDRLKEQEYKVEEFIAGATPSNKEKFINLRSEAHWLFRERLEEGNVDLPNDPALIAQLSGIRYKIRSDKKIQVEGKDEMRKRGMRSPDRVDAVIQAFVGMSQAVEPGIFVIE